MSVKRPIRSRSIRKTPRILLRSLILLSLPIALLMALSAVIIGMFDIIPSHYDAPSTLSVISSLLLLVYLLARLRVKSLTTKGRERTTPQTTSKTKKIIKIVLAAILFSTAPSMIIAVVFVKNVMFFTVCFSLFASACVVELFFVFGISSDE